MDLVVDAGLTDGSRSISNFIGTLLSLPVFVAGLTSLMTLAGAFWYQVWMGQHRVSLFLLLPDLNKMNPNRFSSFSRIVAAEWIAFFILIGIPLLTWIILLFVGSDDWWKITLLTWFCCVTVYYVIYCFWAISVELQAAWLVLVDVEENDHEYPTWRFLQKAIERRQAFAYSGWLKRITISHTSNDHVSHDDDNDNGECGDNKDNGSTKEPVAISETRTLWTRLTQLGCCARCFQTLDPPEHVHSLQDVVGTRQFITRHNWSLEKVFCSHQRLSNVAVVRGPSALLPQQMKSSWYCSMVGILIVILLCVAGLVWMESSALFVAVISILVLLCCLGRVKSSYRIYRVYQDTMDNTGGINEDKDEDDEVNEYQNAVQDDKLDDVVIDGIYQRFERFRATRPTISFGWVMFGLEMGLLVLWPTVTLFVIGNYPIAVLFLVLAWVCIARRYFDPIVLLEESGSFQCFCENTNKDRNHNHNHNQRTNGKQVFDILTNVSSSTSRIIWIYVYMVLALFVLLMAIGALSESLEDSVSNADEIVLLPNQFAYPPTPNLPYPTCNLAKGLNIPNATSTALADYAFLAVMAYQPPDTFQEKLDLWFGEGVAYDDVDTVIEFRKRVVGGQAAVSYHLVTFSNALAVVVVRGSTTSWEWMTDAQLWSGAAVSQVILGLLPLGQVFMPIIHQLLKGLSILESSNLDRVALYKQTTQLVQELQASGNYSTVHITGQSLGGGIALITGAQTSIPASAISGPNNQLSCKTFDPSFTKNDITQFLFNVVPERDIVPRVDLVGMQHQNIRCRARKNDLFGCHSSIRSLCEIMYSCGSFDRPTLCECATKFGYPESSLIGDSNVTYSDVCGDCRTNDGYYSDCGK